MLPFGMSGSRLRRRFDWVFVWITVMPHLGAVRHQLLGLARSLSSLTRCARSLGPPLYRNLWKLEWGCINFWGFRGGCICMAVDRVGSGGSRAGVARKEVVRRARALTDNQMQYVLWASVAPEFREPNTVKGFAERTGVSEQIVHRWAKDPKVVDAIRMLVLANASDPGRVSLVLDFLFETVVDVSENTKNRLQAAKQWLDTVGISGTFKRENDLVEARLQDEIDLASLSDAEVAELYRERTGEDIVIGFNEDGSKQTVADLGGVGVIEVDG